MNVGKAIYYLLANNANVSAITTRIYPEFAPPDATTPFIAYTISNVQPDDTHDGPAEIDEVRMDVICVDDTYDGAADLASVVRVALDRVYGTYNTVNVESIQFTDANIEVRDTPRQYGQDLTFIVRVKRDDVQIATGSPIEDLLLGRLDDVNLDNPLDRQALVYDEATSTWINDGVGQVVIPVRNPSRDAIAKGTVLKATGAQGDRILVAPFEPDTDDMKYFVGIASEVLGDTEATKDGHAQVYGELRALDTDDYEVGDVLYAAAGGTLSTTENQYPIAIVTRKQQNTGRIFIRMWTPGKGYHQRYRTQASAKMFVGVGATVELYYTATADGDGFVTQDLTAAVGDGNVEERVLRYKSGAFSDTTVLDYTDAGIATDATYAEMLTAFNNLLATEGAPITIYATRTEVSARTGLLNEYGGAAAAYSLRQLDTDYTGSAVRVRRASDNAEQDIGFDANGDLDTTSLATFCSGTDGFVKVWYDQAGANDATQTTTGNQPQICTARTNLLLQSNTFSTTWATNNASVTSGQSGYDGTSDAWLFERSAAYGSIYQTLSSGGVLSYSVYAKAGSYDFLALLFRNTLNQYRSAYFNLSNGTLGSVGPTIIEHTIEDIGSGWYRCHIVFDESINEVRIYPSEVNNGIGNSGTGNIYIQDAQLETGSSATDYIETTTSAVSVSEVITNSDNSLPCLDFDGSDDRFPLDTSGLDIGSLSSFVIGKMDTTTGQQMMFALSGGIGGKRWYSPYVYLGNFNYAYVDAVTAVTATADTNTNLHTMIAGSTLGQMQAWLNSSSVGTLTLSSGIDSTQNGIMNFAFGLHADGKMQEVIIYDSDQSSNRTGIESNINTYYSIYTP